MDNNNTDASSCTTTLLCKSFKELFLKTPEQTVDCRKRMQRYDYFLNHQTFSKEK